MIFNNSAQSYARPGAHVGVRQHLAWNNVWELYGGVSFLKAIGKITLAVCVVTVTVNVMFGAYKGHLATIATTVEEQRHEMMDRNITLRTKRATLLTPQSIVLAANKTLALYSPVKGQKITYNHRKERFEKF